MTQITMLVVQVLTGIPLLLRLLFSLAIVIGLAMPPTIAAVLVLVLVLRRALIPAARLLVHTAALGLLLAQALVVNRLDRPADATPLCRGCRRIGADSQAAHVARGRQVACDCGYGWALMANSASCTG